MASASPTATAEPTAGWLNDLQILELTACIQDILEEVLPLVKSASATNASDPISAVVSTVRSACASFAGEFNEGNPRSAASRLPTDVLIAVLYAADMPTRVKASHISRPWRAVSLAERGLWTEYCSKSSPMRTYAESFICFLDAMLRRSDPLPVRLEVDHLYVFDGDPLLSELAAVITPWLHRVQAYEGSKYVFELMNPEGVPLHELVSLDLLGEERWYLEEPRTDPPTTGTVSPQWVPNLRRMAAPLRALHGQSFSCLRELVCILDGTDPAGLFSCFPQLVRAEFRGDSDSRLPLGPIPSTVEEITVQCRRWCIPIAELRVWAGESIPKLVLLDLESLEGVASELLAVHAGPTVATVVYTRHESDILLADAAEPSRRCWAIRPKYLWGSPDCTVELQQLFTAVHIVSLTMSIDCLPAAFHMPHLLSLELRLTGIEDTPPSVWDFLSAPCLQHLVLDVGPTRTDATTAVATAEFEALRQSFRQLIVYNADLLETVTVRQSSSRTPEGTDYAYFAQFAQRYIDLTHH